MALIDKDFTAFVVLITVVPTFASLHLKCKKQRGLYQTKVATSLASIHKSDNSVSTQL